MATTTTVTAQSPGGGRTRSHIKQVIPDGETGDPVYIYEDYCTITCIPSGTGKIQYTTGRKDEVQNNEAIWRDWNRGNITSSASDIPEGPVTAIRGVSVSGQVVVEVLQ